MGATLKQDDGGGGLGWGGGWGVVRPVMANFKTNFQGIYLLGLSPK